MQIEDWLDVARAHQRSIWAEALSGVLEPPMCRDPCDRSHANPTGTRDIAVDPGGGHGRLPDIFMGGFAAASEPGVRGGR
jgi:hypothetical protein